MLSSILLCCVAIATQSSPKTTGESTFPKWNDAEQILSLFFYMYVYSSSVRGKNNHQIIDYSCHFCAFMIIITIIGIKITKIMHKPWMISHKNNNGWINMFVQSFFLVPYVCIVYLIKLFSSWLFLHQFMFFLFV